MKQRCEMGAVQVEMTNLNIERKENTMGTLTSAERERAYRMITGIVVKNVGHIKANMDASEITHTIFADFLERVEKIYDPNKGSLSTFVWKYTALKLRGIMGKKVREQLLEAWDADSREWVMINDASVDPTEDMHFEILVEKLRAQLDKRCAVHPQHGKLELRIFDALVERVRADEPVTYSDIASDIGITGTGVQYYIEKKLRPTIAALLK